MGAVRISNSWLLRDDEGRRFLVDTGHALERIALRHELRRAGVRKPGDLEAILLTHRHSDHAGNAAWLRRRFECPVLAHPDDAAVLEQRTVAARLGGRGAGHVHGVLCHVEDRYPARTTVDAPLSEAAERWGFAVVPVPGHTEGSALLVHEPSGTLFSGDALLAGTPVQRILPRLRLAVPEYSLDASACHRSTLAFLAERPPLRALCSGHGPKITRGLDRHLDRLLRSA